MIEQEDPKHIESSVQLPCPSCGSRLHYSADSQKITCDYCGYLEDVNTANDKVIEKSLHDAVAKVADFIPEEKGKRVYDCDNCGANFMVDSDHVKINCGFCGSTKVNVQAFDHQYIEPSGIIPFYISRAEANKIFKKWVSKGWFHPSKLSRLDEVEQLHGVYLPFWTYDANVSASWSGEAGHYYYENVRMQVNGRMQNQRVQKTRWSRRSGKLNHFFDDVLVVAADGLKQQDVQRILPYRLSEVVNFDPRLMVGWEAEIYNIEVDNGYQIGDGIMNSRLRNMCSAQLGGDTQRNLHVSSNKSNQTFKHIILPVWLCSYYYNSKLYHFTINGQTGRVYGKKPKSWWKIGFAVLLVILFILAIVFLAESDIFQFKKFPRKF